MAYFAEISKENFVLRILPIPDEYETDGQNYLANTLGLGGTWLQTSYNSTIRKNFAGVGYFYDIELNAFIAPQPFSSWVLDKSNCQWNAPSPYPNDGKAYIWNETDLSWEPL